MRHQAARNRLWGEMIIGELTRCGCRAAWVCPGARSAPLAAAAARSPCLTVSVCMDERAAGYQAVNAARAAGRPAAVICTSGTAAANLLPAVVEAALSGVPLVVLTADRPPELRDTGANQTIDQPDLFGRAAAWRFDLPAPDERIAPAAVLTTVDQAVHRARSAAAPVHLNCMFAEPLLDDPPPDRGDRSTGGERRTEGGLRPDGRPYTAYAPAPAEPAPEAVTAAAAAVRGAAAGLLAVGPLPAAADRTAVASLAAALGWPMIADVQSGLRFAWAGRPAPPAVRHHDLVLGRAGAALPAPDVVLHLGGRLTSKAYLALLGANPPAACVHVAEHPRRIDPQHVVTDRAQAAPDRFCAALEAELQSGGPAGAGRGGDGAAGLIDAGAAAAEAVTAALDAEPSVSEPAAAADLIALLPAGWGAFGGGSMPIRDLDAFAESALPRTGPLAVGANRGASGIDGAVASAAGYAAGLQAPVGALIGDLAALHDLGSLAVLARAPQPVVLVVINNDGGGIFSFLPALTAQADVFERCFGTPHGFRFEHACRMFGLDYHRPASRAQTQEALRRSFAAGRPALVEVITGRERNLALHRRLRAAADAAIIERSGITARRGITARIGAGR